MEDARKDMGNLQPMPQETSVLSYTAEFSCEEFERLSHGFIPQEMEDKWFIYLDGNTLHLHRSWTGICIYEVEFAAEAGRYVVHRALVNRKQTQGTDEAYHSKLLHFLIVNLLLGKPVEFPMPDGSSTEDPASVFQHHVVGRVYPVKAVKVRPWWKFW
jgi:hypothetical protein